MATLTGLQSLNPFVPGAGRQPRELAGREKDLEMMDGLIKPLETLAFHHCVHLYKMI